MKGGGTPVPPLFRYAAGLRVVLLMHVGWRAAEGSVKESAAVQRRFS